MSCGYDLRGSDSLVCPECGCARSVAISISDPVQFHKARAALEREKLLVRFAQPGGTIGSINHVYGFFDPGWLWVNVMELERAELCLDEAGVASSIGTRPIVDRSEPICPSCNSQLDSSGREVCPYCAAEFEWVDIEPGLIDPVCQECGYDLTGNSSLRCPECGNESIIAPGEPLQQPEVVESPNQQRPRFLLGRILGAAIAIGAILTIVQLGGDLEPQLEMTLSAMGVGVLIVLLCSGSLSKAARRDEPRQRDRKPTATKPAR